MTDISNTIHHSRSPQRDFIAMWVSLGVAIVFVGYFEIQRFVIISQTDKPFVNWLATFNVDTTFYLFWLAALPIFFKLRRHLIDPESDFVKRVIRWIEEPFHDASHPKENEQNEKRGRLVRAWGLALAVGLISLTSSFYVALQFGDLPPAYHDEYSYLFQAKTFLRGRLVNEGFAEAPELFDQMHVVNLEPNRFFSRYFPGVGLWMAPFVAIGHPYWGHWIAGAITAMLMFGVGRDLAGNATGFLAGVLTALSPGMVLFSNHLLAHHPCLVGLMVFLFCFLRLMRLQSPTYAVFAGVGLSFAMLCRPMTAAGFALPYGVWFAIATITKRGPFRDLNSTNLIRLWFALGLPVAAGLAVVLFYNHATTGNWKTTPYQIYTDNYTPRHVYGFNNRTRGEAWIEQNLKAGNPLPVIENYDEWAKNLTPQLAANNVYLRTISSLQWTLGIAILSMAAIFVVVARKRFAAETWLLMASVLSLHVVHIPYWFSGILNFHYVFETIPLWLLILGLATKRFFETVDLKEWIWLKVWWLGGIAMTVMLLWTSFEPFWSSRIMAGIGEARFAREKQALADTLVEQFVKERPAVVILAQDKADRSIDYVYNSPGLNDDVLRVRNLPEKYPPDQVARLFPDRAIYLLDVRNSNPEGWKGYRIR